MSSAQTAGINPNDGHSIFETKNATENPGPRKSTPPPLEEQIHAKNPKDEETVKQAEAAQVN